MRRRRIIRKESPLPLLTGVGLAALAGFAVGVYVMHRGGGLDALLRRLPNRKRRPADENGDLDGPPQSVYEMDGLAHDDGAYGEAQDVIEQDPAEDAAAFEVERRVLAAFVNDPRLSQATIEISAESDGVVRLRGWVDQRDEVQHAVTIAGGVPGVLAVSNKIRVRRARRSRTQ